MCVDGSSMESLQEEQTPAEGQGVGVMPPVWQLPAVAQLVLVEPNCRDAQPGMCPGDA